MLYPRRSSLRVLIALLVLLYGSAGLGRELTVFAASSLTEAFTDIAARFEHRHPGTEVLLNFDGSATLAAQIIQGAPADIFASADTQQMQRVVDAGLSAGEPRLFAGNRLVVITTEDSIITNLTQLAEPGVLLVLAALEVPVGNYAREALEKMNEVYGANFSERVLANLVSEETNVRQVALKVELGEADAAIVYATDAAVAEGISTIPIPDHLNVLGTYPIVTLRESTQPELAQAFVALVLSAEGRRLLIERGFQTLE